MKMETTNKVKGNLNPEERAPFNLAAKVLRDAGFKQVLIFATRLGSADDAERINVNNKTELKKYGAHTFQKMDTVCMLASVGSHIEELVKTHPEEKKNVAYFLTRLIDAVIDDDPEAITSVTQIEADEETLFVMIVTMLEGLIKKTTKPRSYTRKINQVVASINLALRDTLLN